MAISRTTFLIGLLAARDWEYVTALYDFIRLAELDTMEVTHWRKRTKVAYYYYKLLFSLPLGDTPRPDFVVWTELEVTMLRGYYATNPVLPDNEIAKDMTKRLGAEVSQRAVHAKAHKLGLLTNVTRVGRRLKATGRRRPTFR